MLKVLFLPFPCVFLRTNYSWSEIIQPCYNYLIVTANSCKDYVMIKKIICVLLFIISAFILFTAISDSNWYINKTNVLKNKKDTITCAKTESLYDKKTVVIYYSNGGNTKAVANVIKQLLQCDIAEIKSDEAYKQKNILKLKNLVQEQIQSGYIPKTNKTDISNYEVIFLGSPVWKSHVSLPVKSFLINNNFNNKTIIPFYTFGGKANKKQLDNEINEYSKNANVMNSFLTVWNGLAFLEYQLVKWLNEVYL